MEISSKSNLLEIDLLAAPSGEADFTNFWSTSTLGREVLQGRKLRNEKPRYLPLQKEYDVVNIDYIKSPCDARRRRKTGSKKHIRYIGSSRSNSIFLRSGMSILPCTHRTKKMCEINLRRRQKSHRRCPLKIAELAVPSKRQCIETWRNKYRVLPNYMVERLKRQVFDQKPIAQISDAIYCFKRLKHSPRKGSCKKRRVQCTQNLSVSDAKALSAIFGHKIALHLNKPMTVIMCPRLENISNIVADDMKSLLRKKICLNNFVNHRILNEMAKKVSIWIEMILEQSTYKFQEDQLHDIEEEFGPILDFIDELMENVLDICAPKTLDYIYSYDGESEESALDGHYEDSGSQMALSEETNISEESRSIIGENGEIQSEDEFFLKEPDIFECDDILSISEYIKCEVDNVLTKIVKGLEDDLKDKYSADLDKLEDALVPSLPYIDKDKFEDSFETQPESELATPNPEEMVENKDESAINENIDPDNIQTGFSQENENIEPEKENKDDIVDPNVSDAPQALSEEPEDDSNKKVKFSDIDIGIKGELENRSDSLLLDIHQDDQKGQVSLKSSADNMSKLNINFAPPNENLLSEADESWPEKIPSPGLRPSESISRSITSLGKILEAEEKNPMSSESDDTTKKIKPETEYTAETKNDKTRPKTQKEEEIQIKALKKKKEPESLVSKKKQPTESNKTRKRSTSRDSTKVVIKKPSTQNPTPKLQKKENADTSPKDKRKQIREKDQHKSDIRKNYKKPADKTHRTDNIDTFIKKKRKVSLDDRQLKRTELSKDIIHSHHSQQFTPVSKRDFKVNEQTAPAWLQHKRIESRKDNIHGLNQYEIRKWCKDLDQEYARFEIWNNWLKCMCRNFIVMYQCQDFSRRITQCDYKHWLKFRRNVDKNVDIWTKLNRRARHTLNKTIYICVKMSEVSSSKRYSSCCISRNAKNTQSSPHCS